VRVIDPERVIAAIDERHSVTVADHENRQARLGALMLLSVANDVGKIASGRADGTTGLRAMSTANLMEGDAANTRGGLATLEAQRQVWSNEALRRNSLFPGQGTGGAVFFPIVPEARFVWVQMRVGTQRFAFHFQQTVKTLTVEPRNGGSIVRPGNR
jgi:hypothetical protein